MQPLLRRRHVYSLDGTSALFGSGSCCLRPLVSPVSDESGRRKLIKSAHRDRGRIFSRTPQAYSPEEAMFRDTVRVGQIVGPAFPSSLSPSLLREAISSPAPRMSSPWSP